MDDEINYDDDANLAASEGRGYSDKSEFSKSRVAQESLQVCFKLRATEMKKGYWNETTNKQGDKIRTWVPDARKNFISAVDGLRSILYPECLSNNEMSKIIKQFNVDKTKLFDKYAYTELTPAKNEQGLFLTKTGHKFIPEEDYEVPFIETVINQGKRVSKLKGLWNQRIELYWMEMLSLYDELFSQLNLLLSNIGYFAKKVEIEGGR
jgi:hypothetical protein